MVLVSQSVDCFEDAEVAAAVVVVDAGVDSVGTLFLAHQRSLIWFRQDSHERFLTWSVRYQTKDLLCFRINNN